MNFWHEWRGPLEALSKTAGEAILTHFGNTTHTMKADNTHVTPADLLAEEIVIAGLIKLNAKIPIVAEESFTLEPDQPVDTTQPYWLVDALDGTREFVHNRPDFTVNIALVVNHYPVLGIIYAPAFELLYSGTIGAGAHKCYANGVCTPLQAAAPDVAGVRVLSSRSFGDEVQLAKFLAGRQIRDHKTRPSSLKFCDLAEGRADLYPRFGPSKEWDTAAGQAILEAAGGSVSDANRERLRYGKSQFKNEHFVARGKAN